MMFILLLSSSSLSLLIFCLISIFKWLSSTTPPEKRTTHSPPSPPKLPIIGNLHQLGYLPHRSLQSLAKKHGGPAAVLLLHLGRVPVLVVSSAEAASEVLKTHDLVFSNRSESRIKKRLLYDYKDVAAAPYGEYWRRVRSICVLRLLSNKRVQSFRSVREEEVALMIKKIKESCSLDSPRINMSQVLMSLTNDVVCRAALGRKYSEGDGDGGKNKLIDLFGKSVELLGTFHIGDFIPWLAWVGRVSGLDDKVERVAKEFDDFLEGVIEDHLVERKEQTERDGGGDKQWDGDDDKAMDFVDILLQIQRDDNTGSCFDRVTVKAVILDMFAAGTDTTYVLLEWAMSELLRNPETMKKLQMEVRSIARGRSFVNEEDVEKMSFLKAVIKETLRLHAPFPLLVPRESTRDVKVMGYDIAAGTRVIINFWAIGKDPLSWEDPDKFRPERFLNSCIDFKGSHFQFIPFGAGRRGCPGAPFAMAVDELALANLVHSFDFELPGGMAGEELDMTEANGITVRRKHPLFVAAIPFSS